MLCRPSTGEKQAIPRDAQMHEVAGQIQKEIDMIIRDVTRLNDRFAKLAPHFQQAGKNICDIETLTRKITSRSQKIA